MHTGSNTMKLIIQNAFDATYRNQYVYFMFKKTVNALSKHFWMAFFYSYYYTLILLFNCEYYSFKCRVIIELSIKCMLIFLPHDDSMFKYGLNINANATFSFRFVLNLIFFFFVFQSSIYIEHIEQIQVRRHANAAFVRQTMFFA